MVQIIKNDRIIIVKTLDLSKNSPDTNAVHINNGRIKVKKFSPHVSVRNLTHTGLKINRINNTSDNQ